MANILVRSEELGQFHLQDLPTWAQAEEELALPLPNMQTFTKFPCFSAQVLPSVEPPTKEVTSCPAQEWVIGNFHLQSLWQF